MSSFNGSGTFNISGVGLPYTSGTTISSAVANQLNTDLATGLSNCITKDGQQSLTANIPFNNYKATGLANGTATADAATIANLQNATGTLLSVTGTNTIVGTATPAITSYVAGMTFRFFAAATNTGAVTLNVSGLGAKAITKNGTTALVSGDIPSGTLVVATYDGTQFVLQSLPANAIDSSAVSYVPSGTGAVTTTVQAKLRETVSVKDFGAVGDGVTDDTAAIQAAIDHASTCNKSLIFPEGQYAITQIDTKNYTCTWYFQEAELLAIGTATLTCAVKVRSFNSKFYGMKINLNNKLNYSCAIWWYDASTPSQYNNFFGLTIMQAWRGLVYGEFPGSTSTSLAQSENSVFGLQCYGVWQPLIMNHVLGVITFSGGQLVSHSDTWGASFDNTNNFAFIAYAGCLTLEGCEVQNSVAATTSYGAIVQGGEVYLNGCITEFDVPFQVSGLLTINGGRILNTQSITDMFYIGSSAASSTKIKVNDCYIYRAANVGSFSARNLVSNTGSSQNIEIMFNNCDVCEWASFVPLVLANNQSATFNNCRWFPDGTKNAYLDVYKLDTVGQDLTDKPTIDTKGYTADGMYENTWYGANTTLSSVVITGTAGQFACSANTLSINQKITISGTYGGTGSITGYSNPTAYYIISTNGSTTFTLSASLGGSAITTTAGTPTGLTYTISQFSLNADVPNSYYANSLQIAATGQAGYFTADGTSLTTLKSTAVRVKPYDKFIVEGWFKIASGTAGSCSIVMYDSTGAALATPYISVFDETQNFITTSWKYLRNVITIPSSSTAAYIGFGGKGTVSTIRFCGLKVRRANWNML